VVVVAEWYPSPGDPVHGIWAHRQAVATAAAGASVRVLALRRPVPPLRLARRPTARAVRRWLAGTRAALAPFTLDGIEVTPVPWLAPPRPWSYGTWGWWMSPALHRALDRAAPFDLVHAHCLAPAGHAAARWPGTVPLVVSAHGPDMSDVPHRSPLGRHAVTTALHRAALVLANSSGAAQTCRGLAERPIDVEVLHLGADLPPAGLAGPAGGEPRAARRTIVTVAHLQPRKHHATVLRALAALPPERRPWYLVIGDGEERGRLERMSAELGLQDLVQFAGQLPHEEALAILPRCDLFVMAGTDEPFGVAYVEAMAAGLPAVGGRGEGGPEDIAALGGGMVLVTPGDVAELAGVLRRLLEDEPQRRALGAAARANVAANFTWERCGERTVELYRRALA
jgi:glycosyltransferase involved in cell wall biosynthesis